MHQPFGQSEGTIGFHDSETGDFMREYVNLIRNACEKVF